MTTAICCRTGSLLAANRRRSLPNRCRRLTLLP